MKAWWLGPEILPHGDGRKAKLGVAHTVEGEIVLCKNGLHASVNPLGALDYGSGHFWRVQLSGTIVRGDDKLAASKRAYLWRVKDTDAVLRRFARLCAIDVIHLWDAPDVVVRYLKTGDESLRAATRDAAGAAARAATRAAAWAAWAAARAATWAAARDAAWDAAWDGAWAAARAAAWAASAAARDDIRDRQGKRLHRMLMRAERIVP